MTRREISDALFASAERCSITVDMVRFGGGLVGLWTNRLNDWVRFDEGIFEACSGEALTELLDSEIAILAKSSAPR